MSDYRVFRQHAEILDKAGPILTAVVEQVFGQASKSG